MTPSGRHHWVQRPKAVLLYQPQSAERRRHGRGNREACRGNTIVKLYFVLHIWLEVAVFWHLQPRFPSSAMEAVRGETPIDVWLLQS